MVTERDKRVVGYALILHEHKLLSHGVFCLSVRSHTLLSVQSSEYAKCVSVFLAATVECNDL